MLYYYFRRPDGDGRYQIYCNLPSPWPFYNDNLMGAWPSLQKRTVMGVYKCMFLMDRVVMESWHNGPGNAISMTGG